MVTEYSWFYWAVFSAVFAALTAIFAKVGLEGVDSDLAEVSPLNQEVYNAKHSD